MDLGGIGFNGIEDHRPLAEAANGGKQTIQVTRSKHGLLATKIANDVLLAAPIFPDVLYQVEVGVAFDGLFAHEHARIITPNFGNESSNINVKAALFSTTHFCAPNPDCGISIA